MEYVLLLSEFSEVLGVKIKNILTSYTYLKSLFWRIIYSFSISIIFFSGINLALYKLNPANFVVKSVPNYFAFFYYSFFTIFSDGSDISPITTTAKVFRMAGFSVGVILNLIILTFYITTITSKYRNNLKSLIVYFETYSKESKEYFAKKFKNHPITIISEIKKKSTNIKNLVSFIDLVFGKKRK